MKGSEQPLTHVIRNRTTNEPYANIVYEVLVQTDQEVPSVNANGGLLEAQRSGARESNKDRGRKDGDDYGGGEVRISRISQRTLTLRETLEVKARNQESDIQ